MISKGKRTAVKSVSGYDSVTGKCSFFLCLWGWK